MKARQLFLELAACLFLFPLTAGAQNENGASPVAQLVEETKAKVRITHQSQPFTVAAPNARRKGLDAVVPGAQYLRLAAEETRELWQKKPAFLEMSLPLKEGGALELELVLLPPLDPGFYVTTSESDDQPVAYEPGAYYRGVIKGQPGTVVALSVFEDEIIGVAATPDRGNLVLGRIDEPENRMEYILYSDKGLPAPEGMVCGTTEPLGYTEKVRQYLSEGASFKTTNTKCVRVFLECDYALYQNKGSNVTNTTNFITAAFNNVATLYANEQITTTVSQVHVWTTQDSYPTNSSNSALTAFRTTRTSFNGDLAHLTALGGANLGGIAWVDVLCNSSYRYAYSNIYSSYSTVPTYSWTIYVMTHEMGHNLGSPHTQSCSWTGGALDNCYTTEGGCAQGPAPTNGGTIMSYCHLTSYGINFNNGFGTQPGNLIRNRVNAASCLSTCGSQGCSQPNDLTLRIVVDNYPSETTWNLRNSSNTIVASGGPYTGTPSGTTINVPICVANGCYTLTFNDSYGDGICCSYGNGSYTLINNATSAVIVSGGQFGSQDVKNFCLNPVVQYCSSSGSNATYEYINRVQLNSINNLSGNNGGYGNFTSMSTTLNPGSSYTATLTPGFSGSSYTEHWRVWIDYNRDGDFTDAGEQVLAQSGSAAVSGSFTVPSGLSGTTRMRVSMKYGSGAAPCEVFTYGEVEDYTVVLGSPTPGYTPGPNGPALSYTVQERLVGGFAMYPNPVREMLRLEWNATNTHQTTVVMMDLAGRTVLEQPVSVRTGLNVVEISVKELVPGNYILRLDTGEEKVRKPVVVTK